MPELTRNGVRLHWSEVGSGPCVFWHTGGGGDGSMWERAGYCEALPGRRHLLFDHRGHGRSDRPTELEAHRLDEYAEDVCAVLDQTGAARATVVGYSGGAVVALRFAVRHPERVAALVLIGGVSHPDEDRLYPPRMAENARAQGVRTVLERMSGAETQPAPDWLMENLAATTTEMFVLPLQAWADEPTECEAFPRISAPTLIVCGELENGDGAAELAVQALADGQAVVLPGMGHLQAFWRTDLTLPVVTEFISQRVPLSSGEPS